RGVGGFSGQVRATDLLGQVGEDPVRVAYPAHLGPVERVPGHPVGELGEPAGLADAGQVLPVRRAQHPAGDGLGGARQRLGERGAQVWRQLSQLGQLFARRDYRGVEDGGGERRHSAASGLSHQVQRSSTGLSARRIAVVAVPGHGPVGRAAPSGRAAAGNAWYARASARSASPHSRAGSAPYSLVSSATSSPVTVDSAAAASLARSTSGSSLTRSPRSGG